MAQLAWQLKGFGGFKCEMPLSLILNIKDSGCIRDPKRKFLSFVMNTLQKHPLSATRRRQLFDLLDSCQNKPQKIKNVPSLVRHLNDGQYMNHHAQLTASHEDHVSDF